MIKFLCVRVLKLATLAIIALVPFLLDAQFNTSQRPVAPTPGNTVAHVPVSSLPSDEALESMPRYDGIYFERSTGKTFYWRRVDSGRIGHEDDKPMVRLAPGYVFENATWTGNWGARLLHIHWPWLSPLGFATADTAELVATMARQWFDGFGVRVEVFEDNVIAGPFTRTPERHIRILNLAKSARHDYSAGRIAVNVMRHGEADAGASLRAEAQRDGVI